MKDFFTFEKKVYDSPFKKQLKSELEGLRHKGKKIVFTNGCFDILHIGHMRYLQAARALGDVLVVAVNSDSSVKKIKGENRPINSQLNRAELLSGFECVDFVIIFEETTANNTILYLKPEFYVKGGDIEIENAPETPIVKSYGGSVCIIPLSETKTHNYSTTITINKSSESLKE